MIQHHNDNSVLFSLLQRYHKYIHFKPGSAHRLAIEDPNNRSNDISGGSSNVDVIFRSFSKAFDDIQERMHRLHRSEIKIRRAERSLLAPLLEGNYVAFDWHRQRLQSLGETQDL